MEYTINTENGVMTVLLRGEMDHHSAKNVRNGIDAAIDIESPMVLRLNMSHIEFCDSSGLGFIMGRYRKMCAIGGNLVLSDPSQAAVKILSLAGLDKHIGIETGGALK